MVSTTLQYPPFPFVSSFLFFFFFPVQFPDIKSDLHSPLMSRDSSFFFHGACFMINLAQRALNFVFARWRKGTWYFELNSGFACRVCGVLYKLHESDDSVMGAHEMISPDDELLTIQMCDSLSYFSLSWIIQVVNLLWGGKNWYRLYLFISFFNSIDETLRVNFKTSSKTYFQNISIWFYEMMMNFTKWIKWNFLIENFVNDVKNAKKTEEKKSEIKEDVKIKEKIKRAS